MGSNSVCGRCVTRYSGIAMSSARKIESIRPRSAIDADLRVVGKPEDAADVVVDDPPGGLVVAVGPDEGVEVQRAGGHQTRSVSEAVSVITTRRSPAGAAARRRRRCRRARRRTRRAARSSGSRRSGACTSRRCHPPRGADDRRVVTGGALVGAGGLFALRAQELESRLALRDVVARGDARLEQQRRAVRVGQHDSVDATRTWRELRSASMRLYGSRAWTKTSSSSSYQWSTGSSRTRVAGEVGRPVDRVRRVAPDRVGRGAVADDDRPVARVALARAVGRLVGGNQRLCVDIGDRHVVDGQVIVLEEDERVRRIDDRAPVEDVRSRRRVGRTATGASRHALPAGSPAGILRFSRELDTVPPGVLATMPSTYQSRSA